MTKRGTEHPIPRKEGSLKITGREGDWIVKEARGTQGFQFHFQRDLLPASTLAKQFFHNLYDALGLEAVFLLQFLERR